ncbi:hypothetical protein [Nonomuraea sp. NPDC049624]|uniref:pPIWI_RE_Z domain-containing protein n=1 Tax=Nonomuraea sp. NPDC049624 TaxID=3154354 RepID=UPI0034234975
MGAHLTQALGNVSKSEADEFRELTQAALDYQVELGLRLISRVDEKLSPVDGWTLFGGYPFARVHRLEQDVRGAELDVMLRAARYHLEPMHRRAVWVSALLNYLRRVPRRHRLYDFPAGLGVPAIQGQPSMAANRVVVYDHLLSTDAPFVKSDMKIAEPGEYRFFGRRIGVQSVVVPDRLAELDAEAQVHMNLGLRPDRVPFNQPIEELEETARRMAELDEIDLPGEFERKPDDWESRFQAMELFVHRDGNDRFEKADGLVIDGLLNLIGIPGVGKSTLRDIVTTHAVTMLNQHVVIVVGDVAEALRTVQRFNRLREAASQRTGDSRFSGFTRMRAAPLIGTSTREQHLGRLHRRVSRRYPLPLLQHDPAFAFLSTACPLSASRGSEADEPLPYEEAPCTDLRPVKFPLEQAATLEDLVLSTAKVHRGCPLWSSCPRHDMERELLKAAIWVATPESLAATSLPRHLNPERLRYLELACRRSDLIIVDEADQVQIRLDQVFAPTATLYKAGTDSWLDELHRHNVAELAREGRIQLSDTVVKQWTAALDMVSVSANRIYSMLVDDAQLRDWVGTDFFSAWTLQQELLSRWPATLVPKKERPPAENNPKRKKKKISPRALSAHLLALLDAQPDQPPEARSERRKTVQAILDAFRDDPLDDDGAESTDEVIRTEVRRLTDQTRRLITNTPGSSQVERGVRAVLQSLSGLRDPSADNDDSKPTGTEDETSHQDLVDEFERERRRFEFTLLLSVMHDQLNVLTGLWGRVETALRLAPAANALYHRTPLDYAPVIPESPMGNVLAFQFARDGRADYTRTGELRFVRCQGVGRELLRALPTLHSVEGSRGPNILLMSGTSWAGLSTRYHIAEPVGAVLRAAGGGADQRGTEAPSSITMIENYVYDLDDDTGQLTPLQASGAGERRTDVVQRMVRRLAEPKPDGMEAPLLQELHHLREHRVDRANLLLLTGSYAQARLAAQTLHDYPFWKGRVCVLISDDMDITSMSAAPGTDDAVPVLRRGDVASLRETPYTVLVAPLLAVERGHNILNTLDEAFFGSVFFLMRPFPVPSDTNVLIHSLNDWTVRATRPGGDFGKIVHRSESLDAAGLEWRHEARQRLHTLANREMSWRRLSPADRERLTWDLLVVLWQVIGRLTRGGVDARVHFVDSAFAPNRALGRRRETAGSSLLVSMHDVLAPYLGQPCISTVKPVPERPPANVSNRYLVEALYRPLYNALHALLTSPPPVLKKAS